MQFIVKDVPGNGNCLFEAIGRSLGVPAADLRELVVSFLKIPGQTLKKEPITAWVTDLDDYIKKISRNGFWGGGIEMGIIAQIFHRRILVYTRDHKNGKLLAEYIPDNEYFKGINVLYVGGNHYMQLIPST